MDQGLGRLRADGLEGDPCSYPSTFFVLESSSSDKALAGNGSHPSAKEGGDGSMQ